MERFYKYSEQRESIQLGYEDDDSSNNPSTSRSKSDVDFNDVFGGPPRRRSSVNESESGEEGEVGWCKWPPESEKPVFGDDSGIRKRYTNRKAKDFFDDIFGGDESQSQSHSGCSTPKKRDSSAFSPSLQPLASSLPPSFSLPTILTKGADLRTFGSPPRSTNLLDNGIAASNGLAFSDSHLSRFSAQDKDLHNDLKPSYRQSLLSKGFSNLSPSVEVDKGNNMKHDRSITEVSPNNNSSNDKFHFSIYKWASKDVPLAMPLRTDRTSRTKDKFKLEKCSSAKEWIVTEITTQDESPILYNSSSLMRNDKQDVSTTSVISLNKLDSHQTVEHIVSAKAQSDSLSSHQTLINDVLGSSISHDNKAESSKSNGKQGKKPSLALHSLFSKSKKKQDNDEVTRKVGKEKMAKSSKKSSSNFDIPMNPKKREEKEKSASLRGVEYSEATSHGSLSPSRSMGKGRVKAKVKEFVQIFNQEDVTKPKADSKSRHQGNTYKKKEDVSVNNDVSVVTATEVDIKVDGDFKQSKTEISTIKTTDMLDNNLSQQDDISASAIPDISFADIGDKDESFHDNFTVQVLDQDEDEVSQNQDIQEIQVIDKKIQQWSKGKEGNIRSLLSTLQYVLWPNCGWKPMPLVDIIEGNAVKRSYQRALLTLHPDKLQQKGATSDQKYIAEKVFDILQEAWTQFNMVGAI